MKTTSPRRHASIRHVAATLAGLTLALAGAAPAVAHATLLSSTPTDGAVVSTSTATITLTFDDDLVAAKSGFKLDGPGGTVTAGTVSDADPKVIAATGLALNPGVWRVLWTATASDGHLERGTISFTISPTTPATTLAPSLPATTGAPPVAAPGAAAPAQSAAAPAPAADGSSTALTIVAAFALVAGLGLYVARRSRRA